MTEEEVKMRAALEAQRANAAIDQAIDKVRAHNLRAIRGDGSEGGTLLPGPVDPYRQHLEMLERHNAEAQRQFVELCKELLPLGATQVNCGIFQATFSKAVP